MDIDLQKIFFTIFGCDAAVFVVLILLKRRLNGLRGTAGKAARALCAALCYASAQVFIILMFLCVYTLYVKNGYRPAAGDVGVAFCPFSVLVFALLWRFRAMPLQLSSLLLPLAYSLFLAYRWLSAESGSIASFGYILYNPVFGFIGADFSGTPQRPLHLVSAFLPFACAALGRGAGLYLAALKNKLTKRA